jgi:ribonuclease HII
VAHGQSKDTFLRSLVCSFDYEEAAYAAGANLICGIDEVGRGTLFGCVSAGACILPRDCKLAELRDSKLISPKKRIRLAAEIKLCAVAWSVAHVSAEVIDRTDIACAAEMTMYEAIYGLDVMPDYLLIDAKSIDIPISQTSILHGDALSCSIAAASIVAKVTRDELMVQLDAEYPGYGIAQHKGYGTAAHLAALERLGPTSLHRFSFAPIRDLQRRHQVDAPPVCDRAESQESYATR